VKTVVHLVPRLKPLECGIGDYATRITEAWKSTGGPRGRFWVTSEAWRAGQEDALSLARRDADALGATWTSTGGTSLLVHYSGYGYAKRGAPVWLVRALRVFRARFPQVSVTGMFHELFAFGPPTTSAFWLSPLQRWVTASVSRLCDQIVTNREGSATWLNCQNAFRGLQAHVMPVVSNLGENATAAPASTRANELVLFGYQARSWPGGIAGLRNVLDELKPGRVIILGKSTDLPESAFDGHPVEKTGWLSPEAASEILSRARFGYLAYHPGYLGKSGILAAYLAHGVVPIFAGSGPLSEGLACGTHLLAADDLSAAKDAAQLDAVASAGCAWYSGHDLHRTAELFARLTGTD
jgi:hypothetical protein